jgi:hypothetical protein
MANPLYCHEVLIFYSLGGQQSRRSRAPEKRIFVDEGNADLTEKPFDCARQFRVVFFLLTSGCRHPRVGHLRASFARLDLVVQLVQEFFQSLDFHFHIEVLGYFQPMGQDRAAGRQPDRVPTREHGNEEPHLGLTRPPLNRSPVYVARPRPCGYRNVLHKSNG